jgi:hypothetical protein
VGEVPLSMITGLYFILTGAARFVEEAYRGEWQTKFVHGLRVYQWLAIGAILFGMLLTCISSGFTPILQPRMDWTILSISIGGGFVWAFAMGMDFPHSTIKFSRLSD